MEGWLDSEDEDYQGEEGDLGDDDWMDALDQVGAGLVEEGDSEEEADNTVTTNQPDPTPPARLPFQALATTNQIWHQPVLLLETLCRPHLPHYFSRWLLWRVLALHSP